MLKSHRCGLRFAGGARDRRLRAWRLVVLSIVFVVVLLGCGGDTRKEESRPRPEVTVVGVGGGEPDRFGGRRLYVECIGSGSPTVLLEAGLGLASRTGRTVQLAIGRADSPTTGGLGQRRYAGSGRGRRDPSTPSTGMSRHMCCSNSTRLPGAVVRAGAPDELPVHVRRAPTTARAAPFFLARIPAPGAAWAKPVQFAVDLKGSDALERGLRRLGDTPVVAITGAQTWRDPVGIAPRPPERNSPVTCARRARRPVDRSRPRPCAPQ